MMCGTLALTGKTRPPDDLPVFNREMISLFGEGREKSNTVGR
jgi:hypothetical protein